MATNSLNTSLKLKRQKLRNNEYYNIQDEYDALYQKSSNSKVFKDLLTLITDERNIHLAYRNIKRNKGSLTSGTDRLTIKRWAQATNAEYVKYVRDRLTNYIPQSVRRVEIPKSNGKTRPLGIPTIGDRLIQQCIKQVLEPVCEAKFHKHSYGFRPNRSTKHAIAKVYHCINISKCYHVVDVDIKGFFDNVNHSKLMKQLWTLGIRDKNLLCIISRMLKAEINGVGKPTKGTPQGGILSPLLSNIVLNEFDWWISDQWETFQTVHKYATSNGGETVKFNALRKRTLKEMYLIRYADDFKIMCKSKRDAERIFIACSQWLKERLGLDTSPEKSMITDLRRNSTEFLGIKIGLQSSKKTSKHRKFVVKSHMTEKAKKACMEKLRNRVVHIQKEATTANVMKYNATVLGIQNYYKVATHFNLDANRLAWTLNKILHNRLKKVWTERGSPSVLYRKLYKNNYRKRYVAGMILFPLGDVAHVHARVFSPLINSYTVKGRERIHKKLSETYNQGILRYLMDNPLINESVELNDNRISLYVGQFGKCGVLGSVLKIGGMEVHHRLPRSEGGGDEYSNLVLISGKAHKIIHATNPVTIQKYMSIIKPDDKSLRKINKLRVLVGNTEII
ncbi:Group II intron-encoded protein LtrA [compost metagenome]